MVTCKCFRTHPMASLGASQFLCLCPCFKGHEQCYESFVSEARSVKCVCNGENNYIAIKETNLPDCVSTQAARVFSNIKSGIVN